MFDAAVEEEEQAGPQRSGTNPDGQQAWQIGLSIFLVRNDSHWVQRNVIDRFLTAVFDGRV